jgi:hypothetical protein
MTDAEADRCMTIPMFGKMWRVTVEELSVTRHRLHKKKDSPQQTRKGGCRKERGLSPLSRSLQHAPVDVQQQQSRSERANCSHLPLR